jgi:hypothetical protein
MAAGCPWTCGRITLGSWSKIDAEVLLQRGKNCQESNALRTRVCCRGSRLRTAGMDLKRSSSVRALCFGHISRAGRPRLSPDAAKKPSVPRRHGDGGAKLIPPCMPRATSSPTVLRSIGGSNDSEAARASVRHPQHIPGWYTAILIRRSRRRGTAATRATLAGQ